METSLITTALEGTFAGTLTFPETVAQFLTAGVEYYHVDYIGRRQTFYSADGENATLPILYENLPAVAAHLDLEALRANISDSQHRHQSHQNFTRRAMQAGVQGYHAFLRGQRVTYWGRQGDQHTEWFPGAHPSP